MLVFLKNLIVHQITSPIAIFTYSAAVVFVILEHIRPAKTHPLSLLSFYSRFKRFSKHACLQIVNIILLPAIRFGALFYATNIFGSKESNFGVLHTIIAILALDFALYASHVTMHKVKLFWSFHRVHHIDKFLDVSSAFRFHFLESGFALVVRVYISYLLSIPPQIMLAYLLLETGVLIFQHSNVQLNNRMSKIIGYVFITPHLHRIHHHHKLPYTDTNFGTMFSFWDRIFGTYNEQLSSEDTVIGLDSYNDQPFYRLLTLWVAGAEITKKPNK
ncbi:hypothetical protein SOPP22_07860 [Shewanella sp. OPT22]|nr:hypothetical protein SOPP22_07860 [Shewanella sp. OPT22]